MRSDFSANFDSLSDWRSYVLSKLERWRSQLQDAAENNSRRPTDWRWILIVYNHCLLFLHIPTTLNVRGPAGDWSLRASIQTIMIFRKFQSYKTIPHPWLGVSWQLILIQNYTNYYLAAHQPIFSWYHNFVLSVGHATQISQRCI